MYAGKGVGVQEPAYCTDVIYRWSLAVSLMEMVNQATDSRRHCARAPTDKHRDRNYGRGRVRESPPLHDWLSNVPLTESGHRYRDDQDPGRLHGLYKLTKLIGYYSKYLGLEKRFVANM